jgi:hypothetical protein
MLLCEEHNERLRFVRPPRDDQIASYAKEVVGTVNAFLRAAGKRHLEAVLYPHQLSAANVGTGTPGITAVRFAMVAGGPTDVLIVREGNQVEVGRLSDLLRGRVNPTVPPYLNERRHLRVYAENDLFVLKPSESRYWTRTAGLNDADVILADHWIKSRLSHQSGGLPSISGKMKSPQLSISFVRGLPKRELPSLPECSRCLSPFS